MFNQLVLFTTSGTLQLALGKDVIISISLNEREQDQLKSMCEIFYADRQRTIADLALVPIPQLVDYSELEPE